MENEIIEEAMAGIGIQQNKEKQVNVPQLFGAGANAATKKRQKNGLSQNGLSQNGYGLEG